MDTIQYTSVLTGAEATYSLFELISLTDHVWGGLKILVGDQRNLRCKANEYVRLLLGVQENEIDPMAIDPLSQVKLTGVIHKMKEIHKMVLVAKTDYDVLMAIIWKNFKKRTWWKRDDGSYQFEEVD